MSVSVARALKSATSNVGEARTRRHIQEVKLMLPKMPDTASVMGIDRAAAANVVVARSGMAKSSSSWASSRGGGKEEERKRGERREPSRRGRKRRMGVVRQRWVLRGQIKRDRWLEFDCLP